MGRGSRGLVQSYVAISLAENLHRSRPRDEWSFKVFKKQVQCPMETHSKDWRQTFTKTESVMFSYWISALIWITWLPTLCIASNSTCYLHQPTHSSIVANMPIATKPHALSVSWQSAYATALRPSVRLSGCLHHLFVCLYNQF